MEWINVKERLPNEKEYVLLYDRQVDLVFEGKLLPSNFFYSDRSGYTKDLDDNCDITHWMPLPEKPNGMG